MSSGSANRSLLLVGVNGAKGKMGSEVVRAVRSQPDMGLAFETDLGDDLTAAIQKTRAAVVVDFTRPNAALTNTLEILEAGARPVVGTTGFRADDLDVVRSACERLQTGSIIAPNFAIGAVMLMKLVEIAARHLPAVEIVELHHDGKLDAPSGTALATADRIADGREAMKGGRDVTLAESRGLAHRGIPIHSVRLPGLVAHQEVLLGAPGQLLTVRHDTFSREAFMPGVLLAVRRVADVRGLVYGIEALLG